VLRGEDPQLDAALRLIDDALVTTPARPEFPPRPHRGIAR
jgi:hypothetical protein